MRRIIDNSNQKEKRKGLLQNSLFGKAAQYFSGGNHDYFVISTAISNF